MSQSSAENPVRPDEGDATRVDPLEPTEPRPSELDSRLEEVEQQDISAPGTESRPDWPVPAAPAEDEGPLGEGGQLRAPDAGGGTGF
jgi:hypothetical protein